jgi:hypothetical protein
MQVDEHGEEVHDGTHHAPERYPVTTVDFGRVETPFIIGIWILFASIAKIGESKYTMLIILIIKII